MDYKLYSDGGSRGNPGNAATGFILFGEGDALVGLDSKYLGIATNNQAEYAAIRDGLKYYIKTVKPTDSDSIICHLDSELIVKQMNGEYKIKNPELKIMAESIKTSIKGLNVTFKHVYREDNKLADKLVNISLDAVDEKS